MAPNVGKKSAAPDAPTSATAMESTLPDGTHATTPLPEDQGNLALEAALLMADRGFKVYPVHRWVDDRCTCHKGANCSSGGKHPIKLDAKRKYFETATTDKAKIRAIASQYPDANWSVATGRANGIVTVDADGDVEAGLAPRACIPDVIWEKAWAIVRTPGGGYHLFFQPARNQRLNPNGTRLLQGIDVKGEKGGSILPGSTSYKGAYSWEKPPLRGTRPCALPDHYARELVNGGKAQAAQRKRKQVTGEPIVRGERDTTLYDAIYDLWHNSDATEDEVRAQALEMNHTLCQPPLPDNVIEEKVRRICSQVRRPKPRVPRLDLAQYKEPEFHCVEERFSITGDARRLAENFTDHICYVSQWGWMRYDHGVWRRDPDGLHVTQLVKECLRLARAWAFNPDYHDLAPNEDDLWHRHIKAGFNRIPQIVQSARGEAALVVDATAFDADPLLLNVTNGVLDLRTGHLVEHRPEQRLAKQTRAAYNPQADCPRFKQFLVEIFPTETPEQREPLLRWIQKWIGYLLTGLTREQIWAFLYGRGANGKSTFVDVLAFLLGDYAKPVRVEMLLEGRRSPGAADPDLADTVGARMIYAQEPQGETRGRRLKFDMGRIKELTGGDAVSTRGLWERTFVFRPQFKLMVSANDRPEIDDVSYGAWRRLRLIPFIRRFDEQGTEGVREDKDLLDILKCEIDGILTFAVAGFQMYQQDGGLGNVPDVITEATRQYRQHEDEYDEFFSEILIRERGHCVMAQDALHAFFAWREARGYDPERVKDVRTFIRIAEQHGFDKKRSKKGTLLTNARLKQPETGGSRTTEEGVDGVDADPQTALSSTEISIIESNAEMALLSTPSTPLYRLVFSCAALLDAVDTLLAHADQPVYLDVETTGLDPVGDHLVTIQLYQEGSSVYVVDWRRADPSWAPEVERLCRGVRLVGHHLAFDLSMLIGQVHIDPHGLTVAHDTMLAEQVLYANATLRDDDGHTVREPYGLKATAARHGVEISKDEQCDFVGIGPGDPRWTQHFTSTQLRYMCDDVKVLPEIMHEQIRGLAASCQEAVADLEHAIVPAMANMRACGVQVDEDRWRAYLTEAKEQAAAAEQVVRDVLGDPTLNVNSSQQLLRAFADQGLEVESTSESVLEPYREDYPAVDTLLCYREANKLVGTYGQTLLQRVGRDGRVRANWHQSGTQTGRMSCSGPNLQQLPAVFHPAITAAPGHVLLTADYDAMELRIIAGMTGDERMLQEFLEGRDPHTEAAYALFHLDRSVDVRIPDSYKSGWSYRQAAKKVNFAIVYGSSAYGIAQQLGITGEQAKAILDDHRRLYPQLWAWAERQQQATLARSYSQTPLGRRRYYEVPEKPTKWLPAEEYQVYRKQLSTIERYACNQPIQGAGADILKEAIRLLWQRLDPAVARIVLLVHDEIVLECREDMADTVERDLQWAMCEAGKRFGISLAEPKVVRGEFWAK